MSDFCHWTKRDDLWYTECGHEWVELQESPVTFQYCPFCAKRLIVKEGDGARDKV